MCRKLLQPMKSSIISMQQRRGMLRDQIYDIIPDMLKNIGPAAVRCLKAFYDDVMTTENIPKLWRSANVIAIRKHGKPLDKPTSYRSISLLCFFYKLLGRLILKRLATIFESAIRPSKPTSGRNATRVINTLVLALSSYIESGFQTKLNTGVTVWVCIRF